MNRKLERALRCAATVVGAVLLVGTTACKSSSSGEKAEYWLCAKAAGITMPDGVSVTIWGYALDTPGFGTGCAGAPSLPGPALRVPLGDPTLTIHLRNLLPQPTSIVIPGQTAPMTPVWTDSNGAVVATGARPPGDVSSRVRSFTSETPPNGGEATYAWGNVRPGSYLYHSGTHPQVQVQMGLYGAMARNFAAGSGYQGVPIDGELTPVFSEIDPEQHLAIANGTYGTAPSPTSTLRYAPRYFLINGKPFDPAHASLPIAAGRRTLLRFLNAGLQSYVPTILGLHMKMVAEDGYPYPWGSHPREQYSTLLAPLKTVDAVVVPPAAGGARSYPLYDRRLNLTTGPQPDGGMLAHLAVTP
jgi:FtsP/CotA-like multicopper oxidase with cupredoxin domain